MRKLQLGIFALLNSPFQILILDVHQRLQLLNPPYIIFSAGPILEHQFELLIGRIHQLDSVLVLLHHAAKFILNLLGPLHLILYAAFYLLLVLPLDLILPHLILVFQLRQFLLKPLQFAIPLFG